MPEQIKTDKDKLIEVFLEIGLVEAEDFDDMFDHVRVRAPGDSDVIDFEFNTDGKFIELL